VVCSRGGLSTIVVSAPSCWRELAPIALDRNGYYGTLLVFCSCITQIGETRTKKGKICEKVIASKVFDDYYDVFGIRVDGYHSVWHELNGCKEWLLSGCVNSAAAWAYES